MSEINSQALREAAERAIPAMERLLILSFDDELLSDQELKDYDVDIDAINNFKLLAGPKTVLALLDERERNQQYIKRRDQENEEIALTVGKLRVDLEAAEKRNAKLQSENAYIRNRYKELDLLIGKNILVMQAAIIEWQATGDAKSGLAWIYNTLFGPGELPDESEKDAQAYFNRKYAPIDEKLMELHKWFWEQSEAERAAGIRIKGE
ncbi:ead/Ea22-like family protein [Escherichia coli]|nr:ead/Ea22-like family protein [Escherichia coli]